MKISYFGGPRFSLLWVQKRALELLHCGYRRAYWLQRQSHVLYDAAYHAMPGHALIHMLSVAAAKAAANMQCL
eukprot:6200722-Pleurochrysis_carterae.AAC.5